MAQRQSLGEIQGFQTPLALVRLRYIEEWNLPHAVELYQQDKLKDYLNKEVDRAENIISQLLKEGRSRDQAEEVAIYEILAPLRDEDPPEWPKKLLKMIPEIEDSLKIDYSNEENYQDLDESDEIEGSPEINTKVGTTRESLKVRKRESYLDKQKGVIINHFNRLAELARERELRLKELSDKMDKEGVPMEERPVRFQQIYHEMVEVPDFDPYHVDKLELWKLRNEELLKSKVDAVIATKMTSKGLTYLEAMRELQKELDEILKMEQVASARKEIQGELRKKDLDTQN